MEHVVVGEDGISRCGWGAEPASYLHYHDTEWGRPTFDETTLFEKLCLEGFQSGLSWLTILRKRDAFRERFSGFDPTVVADFGEADVESLLQDTRIIRHRGKIEATISNARTLRSMWDAGESLSNTIWSFEDPLRDDHANPGPRALDQVPATTEASTTLSKQLKGLGFRFVGPTTAYAAMQAMGVVNDHLQHCASRAPCSRTAQDRSAPPTEISRDTGAEL